MEKRSATPIWVGPFSLVCSVWSDIQSCVGVCEAFLVQGEQLVCLHSTPLFSESHIQEGTTGIREKMPLHPCWAPKKPLEEDIAMIFPVIFLYKHSQIAAFSMEADDLKKCTFLFPKQFPLCLLRFPF